MERSLPVAVAALGIVAAVGGMVGSAGARSRDAKRCEDRLVQTLTVQMSSPSPVNSLHLDTGQTYFVYLNGPDLDTQYPYLNVNGVQLNWWKSHPSRRPGMVISASPQGFRAGPGPAEIAYAKYQQSLAGLDPNKPQTSCYVTPPSGWLLVPTGSGGLSFAPSEPSGVVDNRTLTIQVYESELTAPGQEQPPAQTPPPSERYAFTFSGNAPVDHYLVDKNGNRIPNQSVKLFHVSGSGWVSESGAAASGVYSLLIDESGTPRRLDTYFHLSTHPALPVDGWTRLTATVSTTDRFCAKPGDSIGVYLNARKPGQTIGVGFPSCGDLFTFGIGGLSGSNAFVAFSRIKGRG